MIVEKGRFHFAEKYAPWFIEDPQAGKERDCNDQVITGSKKWKRNR